MRGKSNTSSVKAAIYLWSASEPSKLGSLDDQEERCRAAAANQLPIWSIANDQYPSDQRTLLPRVV
jgi:hypothetical protein